MNIKRENMPQIFQSNMEDFRQYLTDNKIPYYMKEVMPYDLTATQGEFNIDKVIALVKLPDFNQTPILASSCDKVIDGHHRWIGAYYKVIPIRILWIGAPIEKCLDIIRDYDRVAFKKINESRK